MTFDEYWTSEHRDREPIILEDRIYYDRFFRVIVNARNSRIVPIEAVLAWRE